MNKKAGTNVKCYKTIIMERRKFFKTAGLLAAAFYVSPSAHAREETINMMPAGDLNAFPDLPYSYDALEPYIDSKTMEIHYDKHHRAYHSNYINAVKGTKIGNTPVEEIFSAISKQSEAVRNNGGGYYNHTLFWNNLSKKQGEPSRELKSALEKTFGSFDKFRDAFNNAAKTRFGSGWAWLLMKPDNTLAVSSTPNQDNPLMDVSAEKGKPLLALDVWEHAYYLKYQNRRPEYIDAFWNVVNWNEVNRRYAEVLKRK
jgi:superoxide dismutase, Fe-Mn family